MRRVHGLGFVKLLTIPAKVPSIFAALAAAALVLTGPMAWGQNEPAPTTATDCLQLCKDGFNTQLTNENQKKAFTACVVQNKCTSAGKLDPTAAPKQNPLLGPFQRF
jgi:hypothetical protein